MRAIIYENGQRKWATDDGGHLLGIQKDEVFVYPDETTGEPGGGGPMNRRAVLRRRDIYLSRGVLELHVEHVDGY